MSRPQLLPCPLCRGVAKIDAYRGGEDCMDTVVRCTECGLTTDAVEGAYSEPELAAAGWNARAGDGQAEIGEWVRRAFGSECARNLRERAARLLEEAIELAQAEGVTEAEAETMVRYTFGRPVGDPEQEAGGVGVTLLAWAAARDVQLSAVVQREIDRVLSKPLAHFARRNAEKRAAGIVAHPAGEG